MENTISDLKNVIGLLKEFREKGITSDERSTDAIDDLKKTIGILEDIADEKEEEEE
jgi:DNA phosphorothioation-dependent restriction protein DptG